MSKKRKSRLAKGANVPVVRNPLRGDWDMIRMLTILQWHAYVVQTDARYDDF